MKNAIVTKKNAVKAVKKRTVKVAKKGAVKKSVETEYDIESAGKMSPLRILQTIAEVLKDTQDRLGEPLGNTVINYPDSYENSGFTPKMLEKFTELLNAKGITKGIILINYNNSNRKSSKSKSKAKAKEK